MSGKRYPEEFKIEAVKQVVGRWSMAVSDMKPSTAWYHLTSVSGSYWKG